MPWHFCAHVILSLSKPGRVNLSVPLWGHIEGLAKIKISDAIALARCREPNILSWKEFQLSDVICCSVNWRCLLHLVIVHVWEMSSGRRHSEIGLIHLQLGRVYLWGSPFLKVGATFAFFWVSRLRNLSQFPKPLKDTRWHSCIGIGKVPQQLHMCLMWSVVLMYIQLAQFILLVM